MNRVYANLLRLYPYDHRAFFAAEMLTAFEEAAQEQRARGRAAFLRFALAELLGLLRGAGSEWIAKLTCDPAIRGRCLPDVRMMRPPGVTRESWFAARCPDVRHSRA